MAVGDYTEERLWGNPGDSGSGSRIYDMWQTVYDEYDSPNWFQDQIWDPMSNYFTGADVKYDFRDPNRLMQSEWGGWFSPFDTRDWESLDEIYMTKESHLTEQADLLSQQHEQQQDFDERVFGQKRDARIERAEFQHEKTMRDEERRKEDIRLKALENLTNLDSIISQSGLSSSGMNQKRQLELDSVQSELNQANMSRKLSSEGLGKEKIRAMNDYESSIGKENLKRDVQYDTKMLNVKQKKQAAHMDLITDKLSVYDEWRAGQVGTVNKMFRQEAHLYDPESLQDAWSEGGEEYELMKGMYDSFSENFDQWKEENPELWAEMLANPEEYIRTDVRQWQKGEMGWDVDFDGEALGIAGMGGLMFGPWGAILGVMAGATDREWTTKQGWKHADLSESQIEQALMNHIFTSGKGQWQGTQFKEEWGEWTPWMVMKDVATHTGEFAVTDYGGFADTYIDPGTGEEVSQKLNPYYYGDFMTDPYQEAYETGDWTYFDDQTPADQYTGNYLEKLLNPYLDLFKDYFYS